MDNLKLKLPDCEYDIQFEKDFNNLPNALKSINAPKKLMVVTETTVNALYGSQVCAVLKNAGYDCDIVAFEAGEKNKNINTIQQIYSACIKHGLDRSSMIIALGGGVVGDMAGFAAATYMRGIRFVQVPTTLLSQVDSSVGGKTGFDFEDAKNIIGAFHQPSLVYINVNTLKTLDSTQFASGMGEVIKHAMIKDSQMLDFLEQNKSLVKNRDNDILIQLVKRNCAIKADVVMHDEKELGLRAILNFGHTIGHAIESASHFALSHGACVALGMVAVCAMSADDGILKSQTLEKFKNLLKAYDLPVTVENVGFNNVWELMNKDKKKIAGSLKLIYPIEPGNVEQRTDITKEQIEKAFHYISK